MTIDGQVNSRSAEHEEGSAEAREHGGVGTKVPRPSFWLHWVAPVLVLVLGGAAAWHLSRSAPGERRVAREQAARVVAASNIEPKDVQVNIHSRGVVQAEQEVTIVPEVGGKVVYVSDSLVVGGTVKKGEVLLRIDPRSYKHQVTQQSGQLENAELQVEVEKNQRALVEYESKLLGETEARSPVASRESHVRAARANVEAQRGAVASARLNLQRTVITAPFSATVVDERVEPGQVVAAQVEIARLVATSELRVEVSIPVEDLEFVRFASDEAPGARALVRQTLGRGKVVEREGEVRRLVQQLDTLTRRARVLVGVPNPFDPSLGLPLLPGARVEVEIEGRRLAGVVVIDRRGVYDGNTVWVVGKDSKLKQKKVEVLWSDRESLYVKPGFLPEERLVTTLLSTPVEGLPVRVQGPRAAPAASSAPSRPGG